MQNLVELVVVQAQAPVNSHAAGTVGIKSGRKLLEVGLNFVGRGRRDEQADAAVDVVTHASGRNDALGQTGGDNPANRESVALVNVGHGDGVPDHSGQGGRVDQLHD